MAFLSDSGVPAALLFAAALFAWTRAPRASVRLNLRFAAVLFASLAVSVFAATPEVSLAVAPLVAALSSTALGLCVFAALSRRPPALAAGLALAGGLILGLLASLSGQMLFALAALIPSAAMMMALGFGALAGSPWQAAQTVLSAVALLGGGLALMEDGLAPALLFFAAGLMGLSLALHLRVQQQTGAVFLGPVGNSSR
jgi:hypothetical protein